MTTDNFYINIPLDIFSEDSYYRCPTTVNLQLAANSPSPQRAVGGFPTPRNTPAEDSSCVSDLAREVAKKNRKNIGTPSLWGHVKKKVSIVGRDRSMDAEDDDHDLPGSEVLDIIDAVAHANEAEHDGVAPAFLPELRASPCLIHHRSHQKHHLPLHQQQHLQRSDARNDLLYSTSFHAGHNINMSLTPRRSPPPGMREEAKLQMERDVTFQKDVQAGRYQTYKRPTLPKEMTSDDFVASWLEHGSEPQNKNHFPEIMHGLNKNKSVFNQSGRKQTLSPIKTQETLARRKSRTSVISE